MNMNCEFEQTISPKDVLTKYRSLLTYSIIVCSNGDLYKMYAYDKYLVAY